MLFSVTCIQNVHCTCIYIGPRQELNKLQKRFEAGDWRPSFCSEAADDEIHVHVDDTCAAATTSLPVTTMEESNTKGTRIYMYIQS